MYYHHYDNTKRVQTGANISACFHFTGLPSGETAVLCEPKFSIHTTLLFRRLEDLSNLTRLDDREESVFVFEQ